MRCFRYLSLTAATCLLVVSLHAQAKDPRAQRPQVSPEVKACQKNCGSSKTTDPTVFEACMNKCIESHPAPKK